MKKTLDEQAADVLDQSADHIDKHGWCQGTNQDSIGRVCLYGSLLLSQNASELTRRSSILRAVYWLADRIDPDGTIRAKHSVANVRGILTMWNDDGDRKKEEVVDLLRKGAKILRNDGVDPDAA